MKTYQLFIKLKREEVLLTLSLLGLLGFFWRSESDNTKLIKNLQVVKLEHLFSDYNILNDYTYIGMDSQFEMITVTKISSKIYYQTQENYITDDVDSPHIILTTKELFILFKKFFEEEKLLAPEYPTRIDVLKNPCITIDNNCELVFKDNTVFIYSIDTEVEQIEYINDLNTAVSKSSYWSSNGTVANFLMFLQKHFNNTGLLKS